MIVVRVLYIQWRSIVLAVPVCEATNVKISAAY